MSLFTQRLISAGAVLCCVLTADTADAIDPERIALTTEIDGVVVVGLNPPDDAKYDFPIVEAAAAVDKIVEAMARVREHPPFSATQISTLSEAGRVIIVYDPDIPDRSTNLTSIVAAVFSPQPDAEDTSETSARQFPVFVTRFGIKWPIEELAPVLIHELVGHGIQHLEGRLESMRPNDRECEAWLYTEMGHQDLGVPNFTDDRVRVRKQLAVHCDDFLRHLRRADPAGYAIWEMLEPDIPTLLAHFAVYLNEQ